MIAKVWPITAMTFREAIRNRVLLGILAVAILLSFAYLSILPMFAFDIGKVAIDLGFASITLSGLAIVIFLGISLLTRDIHQRSVCLILSRPISRPAYIVGKFCGLAASILIAILLITAVAIITGMIGIWLIPGMKPPRNFSFLILLLTITYQYLSLLILLAVAFLFTVLTTNEYLSMLFTLGVYIIGHSLETIVKVLTEGQFAHTNIIHLQLLRILTWVFPNLNAFDLKVHVAYGIAIAREQTFLIAAYGICYILLLLMLTIVFFNRKEIR